MDVSELALGQTKTYVCLRSPDPPYFSAADPNLFYQQLFHPNSNQQKAMFYLFNR